MPDKTLPEGYTAKGLQDTTPEELDAMIAHRDENGMEVEDVWHFLGDIDSEEPENGNAELTAIKFGDERWFDLFVSSPGMGMAVTSLSERDALQLAAAIVGRVAETAAPGARVMLAAAVATIRTAAETAQTANNYN